MAKEIDKVFLSYKVEKSDSDYTEMRDYFNMKGFPTVVVLGPDGMERDRILGYDQDADKFIKMITEFAENQNTILSFIQSFQKDTTDVEANFKVAKRYVERYQEEHAQRYFNNVLKFDPDDNKGYQKQANFYVVKYEAENKKNTKRLQELLQNETDPFMIESGYDALIRNSSNLGDFDNAVLLYKTMLEKLPENANLMNDAAWFVYQKKLVQEYAWAISLAEDAVKLEPKADNIWDTLAWLCYEKGENERAIEAMGKAVELRPDIDYYKQSLQKIKDKSI